jgi:hypothetical protein
MDHLANENKGAFRVKDWWWSKVALLMGMIYLFAAWFNISFEKFIPLSLLSLTTITGFAGMGYLFNDLFDIEKDKQAGKRNFLAGKSALVVITLFLVSAIFVFVPWWFLPKNKFSIILIGVQLTLFIVYSAPPVRLKERGLAGIVTDSLYAHGIPPVLAAYTFSLAAGYTFATTAIAVLFAWQTTAGFRNILIHQWEDLEADEKSGSKNFVARIGAEKFYPAVKWLIEAELVLAIAFFKVLCNINLCFLTCTILIAALTLAVLMLYRNKTIPEFLNGLWRYFPNNVYEKWFPVAYLILLSFADLRFIILLVLHLLLFNFDFYVQSADKLYGSWKSVAFKGLLVTFKIWLSYPVNYFIYYLFRIFGVDLKKENLSAGEYLKRREHKTRS